MAYTICIANQKGGVGKTTTTIELAAALVGEGKRVLVIDFDQQMNLTKYVNADLEKPTIFHVLTAESMVQDAIQMTEEGFSIISSSQALSTADRKFIDPTEDIFLLADIIEVIKDDFDYIIIDNSPSRNILLQMSYVASDGIIMPTEADIGAIDGIVAIYTDIEKFKNNRNKLSHAEYLGFILNKYEGHNIYNFALDSLEETKNNINPDAFVLTVRKSVTASEAKAFRQSMQKYKKWSNPAIDYRTIAQTIIKKVEG